MSTVCFIAHIALFGTTVLFLNIIHGQLQNEVVIHSYLQTSGIIQSKVKLTRPGFIHWVVFCPSEIWVCNRGYQDYYYFHMWTYDRYHLPWNQDHCFTFFISVWSSVSWSPNLEGTYRNMGRNLGSNIISTSWLWIDFLSFWNMSWRLWALSRGWSEEVAKTTATKYHHFVE